MDLVQDMYDGVKAMITKEKELGGGGAVASTGAAAASTGAAAAGDADV